MPTFFWGFVSVLLFAAWIWSLFAIRYIRGIQSIRRIAVLTVIVLAPLLLALFVTGTAALSFIVVTVIGVAFAWGSVGPRNDLDWAKDQERIPRVEFDGDYAIIHNLRRATYRSTTDFDVEWYSQTFDLSEVATVEYVVEPFGSFRAMAHTFVTFGFANGAYLPISIEIRRESPEAFNPVAGLYRQYEIMYVMGDERDLIGLRANVRKDDVFVYPIRAKREQVRRLLESMLRRANRLNDVPEFYNTLTNNCATNILAHLNAIENNRFRIDYRVIAPGLSDRYAYDNGLIDTDLPFDEIRAKSQINGRSEFGDLDSRSWSQNIRVRT